MANSFTPPRCPDFRCRMHRNPAPGFHVRCGSYQPKCRAEPVPRFRCRACGIHFSRQTFRADYRDRRPDRNARVIECLVSGAGLRQTARITRLSAMGVQRKFRKLACHLRRLDRNLLRHLPPGTHTFLFDELETFEHSSILRVGVALLIEKTSLAILATNTAPIRRVPRAGSARRRWMERHEAAHGKRKDKSRSMVKSSFGRLRRLLHGRSAAILTDEKPLYRALLRQMFGATLDHRTTSSRLPRTTYNPLFPVNLTEAILRDNNGRLRPRSWLASKNRRLLGAQLSLFTAWRNWHRARTNADLPDFTPGVALGLAPRSFTVAEMLSWRQDWRDLSVYPTSDDGLRCVGVPWDRRNGG